MIFKKRITLFCFLSNFNNLVSHFFHICLNFKLILILKKLKKLYNFGNFTKNYLGFPKFIINFPKLISKYKRVYLHQLKINYTIF